MSTGERPPDPRPDWATVSRWVDAGKPPLNPDGTWDTPALAASPKEAPSMTETLIDCPKPGCGYSSEGRTPRERKPASPSA